jgi:hypothetical protein
MRLTPHLRDSKKGGKTLIKEGGGDDTGEDVHERKRSQLQNQNKTY